MRRRLVACLVLLFLIGCGGGGGSSSDGDPCAVITRIAGGESCSGGEPNVAFLLSFDRRGVPMEECTGAYISLTSVLTAAHCFFGSPGAVQIASKGNLRTGTGYFIHPLYDGTVGSPFDMAILKVDQPLNGAPLPVLMSKSTSAGESVVAFGYGQDETGKEALARINTGQVPLKATFTTFVGYDQGTSTIVSTGSGSTCPGDSGGPVMAPNNEGHYGIIGITRSGPAGCDANKGRPSSLSSTQSNGAIAFISGHVPDVATN